MRSIAAIINHLHKPLRRLPLHAVGDCSHVVPSLIPPCVSPTLSYSWHSHRYVLHARSSPLIGSWWSVLVADRRQLVPEFWNEPLFVFSAPSRGLRRNCAHCTSWHPLNKLRDDRQPSKGCFYPEAVPSIRHPSWWKKYLSTDSTRKGVPSKFNHRVLGYLRRPTSNSKRSSSCACPLSHILSTACASPLRRLLPPLYPIRPNMPFLVPNQPLWPLRQREPATFPALHTLDRLSNPF